QAEVVLSVEGTAEVPADVRGAVLGFAQGRILLQPQRSGRAANRHRAAAATRADVVCFLDEDTVCRPGWARAHLRAQAERPGIVSGPIGELLPLALVPDLEALDAAGRGGGAAHRRARAVLQALAEDFEA